MNSYCCNFDNINGIIASSFKKFNKEKEIWTNDINSFILNKFYIFLYYVLHYADPKILSL